MIFHQICEKPFNFTTKFQFDQHIRGDKHINKKEKSCSQPQPKQQQLIPNFNRPHQYVPFFADLCDALVSANIPLHKLQHEKFAGFLKKYTNERIPDSSTLRKNYVSRIYENCLEKIRGKVGENNIWISVNETTDVEQRYVAHFIIGILGIEEKVGKSYLLNMAELEATNNLTIATFVNDSLHVLWPDGIKYDRVLLATTDAAPYMKLAFKTLKPLFPKAIHVTCLAHGLQRVAEKVQTAFTEVNLLISSCKKIFSKAPHRKQAFKTLANGFPLPPSPIPTRWGEWLDAAAYYADNFELIQTVVNSFDGEDADSIGNCQHVLKSKVLKRQLLYIELKKF